MRANGSSETSASVHGRERELREREARRRCGVDVLVPGVGDDPHEQPVEPEMLDRLARERDMPVVGRVEGAAEDADPAHCQIMTSSPISTSAPGFTPAARSASSSSSPSGAAPTTRNP